MINTGLEEKVKNLIDSGIKNGTFPGAVVLVEKGDNTVCRTAAGYRGLDSPGDKMTPDTLLS